MRVLHVGNFYPPVRGGMETVLQLLSEREGESINSRVLVANTRPVTIQEEVRRVPVVSVASFGILRSVAVRPTFPLWLRRLRSDIIVIHEPNSLGLFSHFLSPPPGRLVVWFHSEVIRQRWLCALHRPFLRRALRRADRVIVASPTLMEQAKELQDFKGKCRESTFFCVQRAAWTW